MARQRAPKKRVPKEEKELKAVFGKLTEIVASGSAARTTVRDLHFARLLHEGAEQTEAYIEAYKPGTTNKDSLYVMASRLAKKQNVVRELDRLRREEEDEANRRDHLEEILLDGPRLKMEMLKVIYLMATNPDTPDAIRLKAATELGSLKHVDAFVRTGSTFNIDQSKTQNIVGAINMDTKDAGELRASLTSAITGLLAEPAPTISTAREAVIEAEVIEA